MSGIVQAGDETITKARYLEFKDIVPQWSNLSGNFYYYIRIYDKAKIAETINNFTKHWNEDHRYLLMKKDS